MNVYRPTSAVELYGGDGRLLSRFALNLPDDATPPHQASGRMPLAGRRRGVALRVQPTSRPAQPWNLRAGRAASGAIVVSVMLDYQALPFIESQSPYLESLQPDRQLAAEGAFGRDVEFVAYGWSRAPTYTSGTTVWPLTDAVFQRLVDSRAQFWTTVERDGVDFRVFFMSDRGGCYALGYPVITWGQHFVNVAELIFLVAVVYVGFLAGVTLVNATISRTPAWWSGAAARDPVELLPQAVPRLRRRGGRAGADSGGRDTDLFQDAVRGRGEGSRGENGHRRAAARRGLCDTAAAWRRPRSRRSTIRSWSWSGGRSIRTSTCSSDRSCKRRAPATSSRRDCCRRGRRATSTATSCSIGCRPSSAKRPFGGGDSRYLAAAPVRAGGVEGIVTVPITLRRQETERQIDDLDHRVLAAAVLFSLLGAALGYWMAERIADPINRLTRATRRIARGNLDARRRRRSDELGRLVGDFNRMAEDLKRQRSELERTQRLEAWADMARQVAHDIKNPLTPIQLSAEHAQRVNIDRGRPLSPVLDECISGDPLAGPPAAADRRGVFQLRLVRDGHPAPTRVAVSSKKWSARTGSASADASRRRRAADAAAGQRRPITARPRHHQRHRERPARHAGHRACCLVIIGSRQSSVVSRRSVVGRRSSVHVEVPPSIIELTDRAASGSIRDRRHRRWNGSRGTGTNF